MFCGGYGCGKSHLLGFCAVQDAYHSSDAVIAIYEPDHALIRTVAIPRIQYWLELFGVKYTLNKHDSTIYTSSTGIGDFVFRTMDNPELLVGYESYRSHIDELDTLSEAKASAIWTKVLGRNRQTPKGIPQEHMKWNENKKVFEAVNKISAYTTPEGYKFCYKMWVENAKPSYQMVRGKTIDNPTLTEAYIQSLIDSYPANLIEAYMNGEFVNLDSSTVYANYDRAKHESYERIRENETLYIGCDFNVNNGAATIYVRRNGGKEWHAVEELCAMKDTPEMIRIISEKWKQKGHHIVMYPDSSGASRSAANANASMSSIAQLHQAGFEVRAHKKNPLVVDRIAAMNKAYSDGRVFINSRNCPTTAKCQEQQSYDKNGQPDKKSGVDHQNDATTYPIAYEMAIRKPLFPIEFSFVNKT